MQSCFISGGFQLLQQLPTTETLLCSQEQRGKKKKRQFESSDANVQLRKEFNFVNRKMSLSPGTITGLFFFLSSQYDLMATLFQRLWKQSTSATAHITPRWPLDPVVWSFSISIASPNLTFHLWKKKHMKTEFPATGSQPGRRPRGRRSSAQRRPNINAVSGSWDKTGGVDNGSSGHTHYCRSTVSILISKPSFLTWGLIFFLFLMICLDLLGLTGGMRSQETPAEMRCTIWNAWMEPMGRWKIEGQLPEEKLSLCTAPQTDNSYVFTELTIVRWKHWLTLTFNYYLSCVDK